MGVRLGTRVRARHHRELCQSDSTVEGGTHVNGLRSGAADAVREFCEFRNLVHAG